MKSVLLASALLTLSAPAAFAASPFAAPSPLPYHAPQFDKIKDGDYAPAFAQGIKEQHAEIDAIAGNTAAVVARSGYPAGINGIKAICLRD